MMPIRAREIFGGTASGPILWLDEPLSFWGGFDPATGIIIDNNHPQKGRCIKQMILVMPSTRGSGGTPGGVAEAIRNGSGPAAIIMKVADANVMIGAAVAQKLYALTCPVLELQGPDFEALRHATSISVAANGAITVERS
jgi:predicted aconitase with swiveling domain